MNKHLKLIITSYTLGSLVGVYLVMFATFLIAFLNPPSYSVTVLINEYNEAHIELVMLSLGLVTMAINGYWYLKNGKKDN
jgi:hypothetical protein